MASRILIWNCGVFECCCEWPERKSELGKLDNKSKRQTVQIGLESIWLGRKRRNEELYEKLLKLNVLM
jgi:hypothetical protein